MAAPNIDIIKAKIVLLGTRIDAAQADDLRTTIITTTNDDFLRIVESDWLIANEVSDDGDVEGDLALLQSAKYGVKTLSQLLKLRPGSFSDMSMVKAQTLEDAIARSRASTPIAPPK